MNKGVFLTISGRVQGVGFRYFTWTNAKEMALTGWVRNLPDGKVEVLAFGPENELEQFMLVLKTGSLGSKVIDLSFQWLQENHDFSDFTIRY
jgi:acylphosphatase